MMSTASPRIQSRNGNRFTENPGRAGSIPHDSGFNRLRLKPGLGAALAIGVAAWRSLSGATLAGLFSGALTNAPALAAAQEVLRDNHRSLGAIALQQLVDGPVIAFGIAYPSVCSA
jgi:hypothetical protein